ncbi:hypothetical protein SEA_FUNSIZED_62 [Mycobacterium phage Funsized]|nr:hypothetical protein SEA_FUNSIZED_62 [Mycobacterium phage Funsized]
MTDHPTDLDVVRDPRGIEFVRSTTTTRVERSATGDQATTVEHTARFGVEAGTIPDLTHKYGSQQFRPRWLTATWTEGKLSRIHVSGPRVLKSGKLAGKGDINSNANTRDFDWSGWDIERGYGYNQTPVPEVIMAKLSSYATDVAFVRASEEQR